MTYVQEVLNTGEKVVYQAKISLWGFALTFAAIAALFIGLCGALMAGNEIAAGYLFALIAVCVGRILITYYGTELALTDSRMIYKRGFISRYTNEFSYTRIESIHVSQSVLGRLLNYGTIKIGGVGSDDVLARGIADPIAFRKAFGDVSGKISR